MLALHSFIELIKRDRFQTKNELEIQNFVAVGFRASTQPTRASFYKLLLRSRSLDFGNSDRFIAILGLLRCI